MPASKTDVPFVCPDPEWVSALQALAHDMNIGYRNRSIMILWEIAALQYDLEIGRLFAPWGDIQ